MKFGPRKIGAAAFAHEALRKKQTSKFGPRKFGARKAAQMAAELAQARAAMQEEAGEPTEVLQPVAAEPQPATTSIKQMAVALAENGELLDEFIALEKERPGGPRKGAVKLFMGTEMVKGEDAREEVVESLQALLQ